MRAPKYILVWCQSDDHLQPTNNRVHINWVNKATNNYGIVMLACVLWIFEFVIDLNGFCLNHIHRAWNNSKKKMACVWVKENMLKSTQIIIRSSTLTNIPPLILCGIAEKYTTRCLKYDILYIYQRRIKVFWARRQSFEWGSWIYSLHKKFLAVSKKMHPQSYHRAGPWKQLPH